MSSLGMPDVVDHHQQLLDDSQASLQQLQVPNLVNPPPNERFSVLSRIPEDVHLWRHRVFSLEEPLTIDQATWDKYWPYVYLHLPRYSVAF
jgi:hypothetical protein